MKLENQLHEIQFAIDSIFDYLRRSY